MSSYLLDTTVLIDHLRGNRQAVTCISELARNGHTLGLCCVNVAELYSGLSEEQGRQAEKLLNALEYFEATSEAARQAGAYRYRFARRGINLSVSDTLIAAIALENNAAIVTANVKDYPMTDVKIQPYLV